MELRLFLKAFNEHVTSNASVIANVGPTLYKCGFQTKALLAWCSSGTFVSFGSTCKAPELQIGYDLP